MEFLNLQTNIPVVVEVPKSNKYPNPSTTKADGSPRIDQWGKNHFFYNLKMGDKYVGFNATEAQHNAITPMFAPGARIQLTMREFEGKKFLEAIPVSGQVATPAPAQPAYQAPKPIYQVPVQPKPYTPPQTYQPVKEEKVDREGKDRRILSSSVIKSLIESGYNVDDATNQARFDKAFSYYMNKIYGASKVNDEVPPPSQEPVVEEIDPSSIPF